MKSCPAACAAGRFVLQPRSMKFPVLVTGKRYTLPRPLGSADALLLARFAQARTAERQLTAIVTAEPADAQRLPEELAFFAPELRVAVFPDWETLPYDSFSPHQDLISERLATLWRILQARERGDLDVVLMPATTALVRLAPPAFLAAYTFNFAQKQKLDEASLKAQLTLAGYQHVSQVVSPGEYAVRGGLIDLFPMGSAVPYRVDLFDNEVDSIRTFDPDSQRSLYPVPEVRLLPGREFPMDEAARTAFRARWRERVEGDPTRSRIYKDMGAGLASPGIEFYLPLFFDETATVFDYLGAQACVVLHGEVDAALQKFWTETRERHRFLQHDPERPILAPQDIYLPPEAFFTRCNEHAQLSVRSAHGEPDAPETESAGSWACALPDLSVERGTPDPLRKLEQHLAGTTDSGARVLLVAESDGRRESVLELLRDHRLEPPTVDSLAAFEASDERYAITVAPLAIGFHWVRGDGLADLVWSSTTAQTRLYYRLNTTSGIAVSHASSASLPFSASSTAKPRFSRMCLETLRMIRESSTIRHVFMVIPAFGDTTLGTLGKHKINLQLRFRVGRFLAPPTASADRG